ncbi:unnamed protein product [Toxocara canis]|uniref:DnaJ_C domain-containing protein n=1 Tax=Toxocara canis TaxID=6265 RepID=A0A183U0A2_TOXCA|nr:unnamed protein product [Toxocara canis]
MPSYTDNSQRGILYVTFDVDFPRGEYSPEEKASIASLLKQNSLKPKYGIDIEAESEGSVVLALLGKRYKTDRTYSK